MSEQKDTFIIPAECRLDQHKARDVIHYIDGASAYYSGLARHCFMLINHHVYDNKEDLNKHLQKIGNIKTRTAKSMMIDMEARYKALKELKKLELTNLDTKIEECQIRLEADRETVNTLKILVATNFPLSEECMAFYRSLKRKIWQFARKLNAMLEQKKKLVNQMEIDTYSICFGTRKLFKEQYTLKVSGWKDHEDWRREWISQRQRGMFFIGSAYEANGNQMCHLKWVKDDLFQLKILHHDKEKRVAATGIAHFTYLTEEIKRQLALHKERSFYKKPISVRFIKRKKGWYMQLMLNVNKMPTYTYDRAYGVIGIDFNSGFISVSETDDKGNLVGGKDIRIPHMGINRKKSLHELRIAVKTVVQYAAMKQKPIAVEDLNFNKKKAKTKKGHKREYNRMLHGLAYSVFYEAMERRCFKDGVELIQVNPAYTSKGAKKYLSKMKLTVHRGAAWMIARKAMGYKIIVKKSAAQTEHEKNIIKIKKQKGRLKKKKAKQVEKRILALKP